MGGVVMMRHNDSLLPAAVEKAHKQPVWWLITSVPGGCKQIRLGNNKVRAKAPRARPASRTPTHMLVCAS